MGTKQLWMFYVLQVFRPNNLMHNYWNFVCYIALCISCKTRTTNWSCVHKCGPVLTVTWKYHSFHFFFTHVYIFMEVLYGVCLRCNYYESVRAFPMSLCYWNKQYFQQFVHMQFSAVVQIGNFRGHFVPNNYVEQWCYSENICEFYAN